MEFSSPIPSPPFPSFSLLLSKLRKCHQSISFHLLQSKHSIVVTRSPLVNLRITMINQKINCLRCILPNLPPSIHNLNHNPIKFRKINKLNQAYLNSSPNYYYRGSNLVIIRSLIMVLIGLIFDLYMHDAPKDVREHKEIYSHTGNSTQVNNIPLGKFCA